MIFGIPSISNTPNQDTVVIHYEDIVDGIEAPAITIAPIHMGHGHGWKSPQKSTGGKKFSLFNHCKGFNATDISVCIENDTYEKEEFLNSAKLKTVLANSSVSTYNENKFSSSMTWSEDLTVPDMGRHYTLKSSITITPNAHIIFNLFKNYSYQIWVHDEHFFIPNNNPFGPPSQYWKVSNKPTKNSEDSGNSQNPQNSGITKSPGLMHRITLTKQKKLNLERSPCNEDPVYSFTTCVKERLSKIIGCRLPWDKWSDQNRKMCESENEFRQFEQDYSILYLTEFDDIVGKVGCMKPCVYNEFKFVDYTPEEVPSLPETVGFWPASKKTHIEEEVLLYPFTSFLAEFGGAIGLFFGFSFLTIWQEIRSCFIK